MIYDRYYYSKLNNSEQKAYKDIYAAMQNHEPTVIIKGLVKADIPKLMSAINLDNPHLFFVDFNCEVQSYLFNHTIKLKYIYNQVDATILIEKVKKVCNKILSKVTGKTEFEKELSLHDILARNVIYDESAKNNLLKFHARSNTILGVLFYKTAVCEGIAKIFKLLLNALDIKCIVVNGKATDDLSGNVSPDTLHAWNMVKIDGKPYHIDLTWDINLSDKNLIRHDYFNLNDTDITIDHVVSTNFPQCRTNNHNYFYQNGLIVAKSSDLQQIISAKIENGEKAVEFKVLNGVFEKDSDITAFVLSCFKGLITYPRTFSIFYTRKSEQNVFFYSWEIK